MWVTNIESEDTNVGPSPVADTVLKVDAPASATPHRLYCFESIGQLHADERRREESSVHVTDTGTGHSLNPDLPVRNSADIHLSAPSMAVYVEGTLTLSLIPIGPAGEQYGPRAFEFGTTVHWGMIN